jgi:O-antigen/teichoic acid export membrane protein
MIKSIKNILRIFGIDGAIFYTSLARIIMAFAGIITIFFVARFLTGIEQGFYYTFGSVLAIQVFFELGFNGVITQYVAHEVSHLKWDSAIKLSGSNTNLSRLSSLLHFAVKWYLITSGFLAVILLITGFIFFSRYDKSGGAVEWIIPWIILSFSTSVAFIINPLLAFIEGLGKIKQVALIRLVQQATQALVIWAALLFKVKLFAIGIGSILGLLTIVTIILVSEYRVLLLYIWKALGKEVVKYRKEIFPYQWKIALSSISGYFIFQLFNPVLFATEGALAAGQMGMTLTVLSSISSLSFSWMTTKVPLYSGLIAQKKYFDLDKIFNKTLNQSVLINGLELIVLLLVIYGLRYFDIPLGERFLPYFPLILLMLAVFMNQFVNSWATYLRCHKQEPFLIPSVAGGILTSLSTIILGKHFGVVGMTMGYCILTFFGGFLWGFYIFKNKKEEWHYC